MKLSKVGLELKRPLQFFSLHLHNVAVIRCGICGTLVRFLSQTSAPPSLLPQAAFLLWQRDLLDFIEYIIPLVEAPFS